jgi:hypothetical protein
MTSSRIFPAISVIILLIVLAMVSCETPGPTESSALSATASTSAAPNRVDGPLIRGPESNTSVANYVVGPGKQTIEFNTGASPPLNDLRFIFGGPPKIMIQQIEGKPNGPIISFLDDHNPDGVAPSTVNRQFANTLSTQTASPNFDIIITNRGVISYVLTVVGHLKP